MTRKLQNTLYITTQGAYLRKDHETLVVEVNGEKRLQIPGHHLNSVVIFGQVLISPGAFKWCAQKGINLTHLSLTGRYIGRFIGPKSGNVLLRLEQFQTTQNEAEVVSLSKSFVAGKIQNSRQSILRSARDHQDSSQEDQLRKTAEKLRNVLSRLEKSTGMNVIRGLEGEAARTYFDAFDNLLLSNSFMFEKRTKYPPKDPINALLSFLYALLRHDCCSAVEGIGLDPQIGFLHSARPGRPSLSLDLMEEFRPILADRIAITLINRNQVKVKGFSSRPGGSVQMSENTLKTVIKAYQKRKEQELTHSLLDKKMTYGMLPHIQARLLSRTLRGDLEMYPAYIYR